MYLRKPHLETLKALEKGENVRTPSITDLYLQGLINRDGKLTEAGRKLLTIPLGENVFIASDIMKIIEFYMITEYLPSEWKEELIKRGVYTASLEDLWEVYNLATPNLLLTPPLISLLDELPPAGFYETLIKAKEIHGEYPINALQAMRLLFISPPFNGKRTYSLSVGARKLQGILTLTDTLMVEDEDITSMEEGKVSERLVKYGLQTEKGTPTEAGRAIISVFREKEPYVRPFYLLREELEVLKLIKEGKEVEDEGIVLLLKYKGLLTEEGGITDDGLKAIDMGEVSLEGMRAVVYSYIGEVSHEKWLETAKQNKLIDWWITYKGEFYIELSKKAVPFPYLTKYDVAIITSLPLKGSKQYEELKKEVEERVGVFERALGEAETKGFIRVYPNNSVVLTEDGKRMKEIVEYANIPELLATTFIITPESWRIIRALWENEEEVNKIWKKSEENRKDYYEELKAFLSKETKLDEKIVDKYLKLLHLVGFIGSKYLTEAGRKLATFLD